MRLLRILTTMALLLTPALLLAQPPTPPGQEEFVPMSQVPPEEQIPAFTLVAAAYALVWLGLVFYLWTIASRMRRVEQDLAALEKGRR